MVSGRLYLLPANFLDSDGRTENWVCDRRMQGYSSFTSLQCMMKHVFSSVSMNCFHDSVSMVLSGSIGFEALEKGELTARIRNGKDVWWLLTLPNALYHILW